MLFKKGFIILSTCVMSATNYGPLIKIVSLSPLTTADDHLSQSDWRPQQEHRRELSQ